MRALHIIYLVGLCLTFAEARIGTFWHVSDFHLDTNYSTAGDPSAMCWASNRIVPKPGIRGRGSSSPGKFGNYLCDAPLELVMSAVDAMKELAPDPDFVMWTGDDTAHVDDKYFSTDKVFNKIARITEVLKESFPNTTFLPVMGNHDYYKKNQIPSGKSELQSRVADLWGDWLRVYRGYDEFHSSGRYVADIPKSKVSVLAMNTLLWYKNNNETASDPDAEDPDGHFAWAERELRKIRTSKRRAYLMGHIPPGSFERYQQKAEGFHWYQDRYNTKFLELIHDHADVIEGQFFAHHHTDSFRLFFQDDERGDDAVPISYQLIVPGVTPWKSSLSEETGANNPGIRLVSYDTETGKVLEVATYFLNLTEANLNGRADWAFEYNFTSEYNLSEISPSSLFNFTRKMQTDTALFDRYYRANTVKLEDPSVCTSRCKKLHWCSITEIDYERFHQCNSAKNSLPWTIFILVTIACLIRAMQ